MNFIHQIEPFLAENDIEAVSDYLRGGGWLTEFQKTAEFEGLLSQFLNVQHTTVVTSGSSALYLALLALGIGPGDSVIVPDFTMIATPNAVRWVGAEVVLCDVDPQTLCLDLDKVQLRPDTKAMMYVPINGRSGEMSQVVEFCRQHNLLLIEDACQALGSNNGGQKLGTFGDVGVFSFTPHKIITTGQGGAVVTDDDVIAAKVRKLKDFHRVRPGVDQHDGIGFNFKFTDLQAVIGIEQLKIIDERIARRRENWQSYAGQLAHLDWLEFPPINAEETTPWFADVLLKGVEKQAFINDLKSHGIGARTFYPPIHTQPPYAHCTGDFSVTTDIAARGVWLPSSIQLKPDEMQHIVATIKAFDATALENRPQVATSNDWLQKPHWNLQAESKERTVVDSDENR